VNESLEFETRDFTDSNDFAEVGMGPLRTSLFGFERILATVTIWVKPSRSKSSHAANGALWWPSISADLPSILRNRFLALQRQVLTCISALIINTYVLGHLIGIWRPQGDDGGIYDTTTDRQIEVLRTWFPERELTF